MTHVDTQPITTSGLRDALVATARIMNLWDVEASPTWPDSFYLKVDGQTFLVDVSEIPIPVQT